LHLLSYSSSHHLVGEAVADLVESFSAVGQIQPISVRRSDGDPEKYEVICGAHRAAAAAKLNWATIDALLFEGDIGDLTLIEVAENLHRKELSALDRARLQTKWLNAVRQKDVQHAHPGGVQPHDKGYSKAARLLGSDSTREEIRRSEAIASIPDEVIPYLLEHKLQNNKRALLEVAEVSGPAAQIERIRHLSQKKRTSAQRKAAKQAGQGVELQANQVDKLPAAISANASLSLPAFLDRRDSTQEVKNLSLEWTPSRLRCLLLEFSEVARIQFIKGILLPELGMDHLCRIGIPDDELIQTDELAAANLAMAKPIALRLSPHWHIKLNDLPDNSAIRIIGRVHAAVDEPRTLEIEDITPLNPSEEESEEDWPD
jgi:ParB family chromosome partitioning protein